MPIRELAAAERHKRYSYRWGFDIVDGPFPRALAEKAKYSMPDGSYPINNCSDVGDAAGLGHHSKTYPFNAVRAHVMRAKRALKCPDSVLPGTWKVDRQTDDEELDDAELVGEGVHGAHVSRPLGSMSVGAGPGEHSRRAADGAGFPSSVGYRRPFPQAAPPEPDRARGMGRKGQGAVVTKREPMGGNALRPFDDGQASELADDDATDAAGPHQRFTKAQVKYGAGTQDTNCGNCRFFQGDSCLIVQGSIAADMWCDHWRAKNTFLDDPDRDSDAVDNTDDGINAPDSRARSDGDSDDASELEEINPKHVDQAAWTRKGYRPGKPGPEDPDQRALPGAKLSHLDQFKLAVDLERFYRLNDQDIATTKRSWMPVFPEGVFSHPEYGQLVFDDTTIPQYIDNFRQKVRHIQPCVDIDHRNEEAAGWVTDLEWRRGDGLYGLVEWNDLGISLLKDKRYKYASAQFGDYRDEATGDICENVLSAITLTNFPFLKRMGAIQLAEPVARRQLWSDLVEVQARVITGDLRIPQRIERRLARVLDGRVVRLSEARAIAGQLASLGASNGMPDKTMTLPRFVKRGDASMRKADDDDAGLDDDDQTAKRARRAKAAKRADDDDTAAKKADDDDQTADDSDLDDDDATADDDDAAAKKASMQDGAGYDSDDMWREPQSDQFAPQSKQVNRSDGKADGQAPDLAGGGRGKQGGMKGRATSEPRFMTATERRLADENRQLRERVAAVETTMREQTVAGQLRRLAEPHDETGVAFGPKVLDLYEQVALKDRATGDLAYRLLKAIREDGGLLLGGEWGSGDTGDEHDPYQLQDSGASPRRDSRSGDPVVGSDIVRLAKDYATEHKLDWSDPDQKLEAMDAVASGNHSSNGRVRAGVRAR